MQQGFNRVRPEAEASDAKSLEQQFAYRDQAEKLFSPARMKPGWFAKEELLANDGEPLESFGRSVAVNGSTAIVGAYHGNIIYIRR